MTKKIPKISEYDKELYERASPEMKEFIKQLDELIDAIENSSEPPMKKLEYITKLLETVQEEKKKAGLG